MKMLRVNRLQKRLRAEVVREHMRAAGIRQAVCLTCGNAAQALRDAGVDVIAVGPREWLRAGKWLSYGEVAFAFRNAFDATSGHLPVPLMVEVSRRLREALGELEEGTVYAVPCGSGETVVCLTMAYPSIKFSAWYGTAEAVRRESGAPLNALVDALTVERIGAEEGEIT